MSENKFGKHRDDEFESILKSHMEWLRDQVAHDPDGLDCKHGTALIRLEWSLIGDEKGHYMDDDESYKDRKKEKEIREKIAKDVEETKEQLKEKKDYPFMWIGVNDEMLNKLRSKGYLTIADLRFNTLKTDVKIDIEKIYDEVHEHCEPEDTSTTHSYLEYEGIDLDKE